MNENFHELNISISFSNRQQQDDHNHHLPLDQLDGPLGTVKRCSLDEAWLFFTGTKSASLTASEDAVQSTMRDNQVRRAVTLHALRQSCASESMVS